MQFPSRILRNLWRWPEQAKKNFDYFERRRIFYAIVAAIGFPLYYFVWNDFFPQRYENLTLRLIGTALFLPIIFANRWPAKLKKYLIFYWYFCLLYTLPFFFAFMLFKNDSSIVWIESTLIAIFVMASLLDWLTLVIQCIVGVGLAWLAYLCTTEVLHGQNAILTHLPTFLFAIALGTIANYSGEIIRLEQERRLQQEQAMLATAGSIAHELRTPLLGIRSGAAGLRGYLPALVEAYRLARKNSLPVSNIRRPHLEAIAGVLERIQAEANYSNAIIDILIANVRLSKPKNDDLTTCSMKRCISIALQRYPFSEHERAKISSITGIDFEFKGVELLMVHVVFNLLKNSLHHISKSGKGRIYIHAGRLSDGHRLVFRDTAAGIPAEVLPHVFKRFYSSPANGDGILGSGIGLAFCSDVVQAFGGTIECSSVYGEFCEFTLTFPTIKS